MFKFLHTADIHLDSPLRNLDQYDGAPVSMFRNATRNAFDKLIELAIDEEVAFIVISGDLYDGECKDSSTPLHFRRQMVRLNELGIRVFMIQGNHDASASKAFSFNLPENVRLLSTKKPESIHLNEFQVVIHGQGFARRDITENLSDDYPDPVRDCLNIGMLHTSCGEYESHDTYAPSTVAGLTNKGYQYWALGHIHKRERLAQGRSWIVYPGCIQGRHIRETGPKGCALVTVDEGEIKRVQDRIVDVVRWEVCEFDAIDCKTAEEVVAGIQDQISELVEQSEGRPLAVRIQIMGATQAHHELMRHPDHWDRTLREAAVDQFDDRVWIEKIKFKTKSVARSVAFDDRDDALRQLMNGIQDLDSLRDALNDARPDVEQLLKTIPTDPRADGERLDLDDESLIVELAEDVKALLIGKLLEAEEPA